MTTTGMQTVEKIRRTSDGTAICRMCGKTIPKNEPYQLEICNSGRIYFERKTCMDCLTATHDWNVISWLLAAALAVTFTAAALAFGLM